jgi:hypothetical protein
MARKSNFGNRCDRKQVHFVYTCCAGDWFRDFSNLSNVCGIFATNPTKASHLPFLVGSITPARGRFGDSGTSLAYTSLTLLRVRLPPGQLQDVRVSEQANILMSFAVPAKQPAG